MYVYIMYDIVRITCRHTHSVIKNFAVILYDVRGVSMAQQTENKSLKKECADILESLKVLTCVYSYVPYMFMYSSVRMYSMCICMHPYVCTYVRR